MTERSVDTLGPMSDRFVSLLALSAFDADYGDVSERTRTTREIGAHQMVEHLASGDWSTNSHSQRAIKEYLGRVLANAERQGIGVNSILLGDNL